MIGEQFNPAKAIFLAAIDEHAPEQWPAFLEQACGGDPGLRAEVEKLLRAEARMGAFHEGSRSTLLAAVAASAAERPGTAIGPYKLLEQIGEGGFGVVFMAEQHEPIRRQVALKLLKAGMDSKLVIARFEAERQALALMDHPNIARVLDAGTTETGRPYFVMELVKGVPITEFCDRNHLPLAARLKLFVAVCHAVQHAHHKGVIHRDLKPSNVLVTLHDGPPHPTLSPRGGEGRVRGVVKVIDFGIAKATGLRLTELTLFTAHGEMIGTPAYMSPEQADRSGLDIDTRSDIYSLGVLLYELLTGTTPLEVTRLHQAGYMEIQRLIREEEAPRPSTRLSSLGNSGTVLASKRGLDVKRLTHLLAGDLDWVVMKALEKDRNRRYATPDNFAEDIERYLRREPVLARPPSLGYKLRKFAQRNRAAVLTGVLVATALLVGTAGATWQAVCARRAEDTAVAAAAGERRAKAEAEARDAETRAVLRFVDQRVFGAAQPRGRAGGLGPAATLREALRAALPYIEKDFANQPLIEARVRLMLGTSFAHLGDSRTAARQFAAARALYIRHRGPRHPDTLATMNNLANSYAALGRHADARELYEEVLTALKAARGPDHPDTLAAMNNLANGYQRLGWHADALRLHDQTLALRKATVGSRHPDTLGSMNNLANSFAALRRHDEALKLREHTLALRKGVLGSDHPDTLGSMTNLGNSYAALGRHADALRLRRRTLARMKTVLGPDHPDTLWAMNCLARSYEASGRHADALHLRRQALALREAALGPDHPDTLLNLWGVAASLTKQGRGAEAVPVIEECVRRAADKEVHPYLLAGVMNLRMRHFAASQDGAGCRQTAEMWERLNRADPSGLYMAARMRAITAFVVRAAHPSDSGAREAEAEAERAMGWLKRAVAAGYSNAAHLRRDRGFDALRGRADFTALVKKLESTRDRTRDQKEGCR
jgi:serine/threonine protein kinase